MREQQNDNRQTRRQWYVMVHLRPSWIETMLLKERRGELIPHEAGLPTKRQTKNLGKTEDFDFFVPFQFMRPDVSDEVRGLFHDFVFIRASGERLEAILRAEWNVRARLRLRHYRNKGGKNITISDEEFQQLKATLLNRQLKVFFGHPIDAVGEMAVGDSVTLLIDGWQGRQGKIERIRLKKGRVAMVVAVNILGSTKSVNFEDLHDGDVAFADHDTEQLLTGNLIDNIEMPIATMLGHYCRKDNAEQRRRDYPQLNRFLSYANIQIDDENNRRRFSALMLMCAMMLDEKDLCRRYATQLQEWVGAKPQAQQLQELLANRPQVAVVADVYVLIALFVYTHNPVYRDAAKAYRKAHPDCPAILGTLINKVRNISTVKPNN